MFKPLIVLFITYELNIHDHVILRFLRVFKRTYKLAETYHKNGIKKKSNLSNFWLIVRVGTTVLLRDEERSKRELLSLPYWLSTMGRV